VNGIQFLFNAEFDFELRNSTISPQILTAVESMAPLFSPALDQNDTIISSIKVPHQFYEYLADCRISTAHLGAEIQSNRKAEAWGWSSSILEKITRENAFYSAPSPETCRVVNSRMFAHNTNTNNGFGVTNSHIINSKKQLLETMKNEFPHSLVLKPFFGNSGAGFLFLNGNSSHEDLLRAIALVESEPVICEPWLERVSDIASLFQIDQTGHVEIIGHHRNICNQSGSFYGTLIVQNDPVIARWLEDIVAMIKIVAGELHREGYFGVVSIDSFTYLEKAAEKIALNVDINCRYTMSYIAHSLFCKLKQPAIFYRFISRKRHTLPSSTEELKSILGEFHFDETKGQGIFLASPLRITGKDQVCRQPIRSAFCVVAESVEAVFELDEQLRKRILRSKKVLT